MTGKKRAAEEDELHPHLKIQIAAYERWQRQGMPSNTALDDWLAAEAEMAAGKPPKRRTAAAKKKKA